MVVYTLNGSFWGSEPRVLVTGSTGLVGSAIRKVAFESGPEISNCFIFVSSKDGDLSKAEECEAIFEKNKPTHVLHLAAFVGGLFKNQRLPVDFWTKNVNINNNVLASAHKHHVEKVISCLSTCIFPDKTTYPIDETMIHDGPPHYSNEPYAYAKRMVDVLNRAYNKQYGCKFTSVVPTNIYGPNDNFSLEDGHVIPSLVHKCYLAKKNSTAFKVLGSGKPLRQFVYSEDLARIMIKLLQIYEEVEPVIVSIDEEDEVSISDVAELIAKALEFDGEIIWDRSQSDGQYKKTASNKKLKKILPNISFRPMEEGIKETCKWFDANFSDSRK